MRNSSLESLRTESLIGALEHALFRKCWDIVLDYAAELERREKISEDYLRGVGK